MPDDLFEEVALRAIEGGQAGLHRAIRKQTYDDFLSWPDAVKYVDSVESEEIRNQARVSKNDIDALLNKADATVRRRLEFVAAELTKRGYPQSMFAYSQLTIYKTALDHVENPHLHK